MNKNRLRPMPPIAVAITVVVLIPWICQGVESSGAPDKSKDTPAAAQADALPDGAVARLRPASGQAGFQIGTVAFSPDSKLLATGSQGKTVRLWEVATGKPGLEFAGHLQSIACVRFSPDGRILASCGDDFTIRLWEVASGRPVRQLTGHQGATWFVAFSPDGKTLASSSEDGSIRLWELETGRELRQFLGHQGGVWPVTFSPDGRAIASGGADGTVRVWDVATGKEARVCRGHQGGVWPVMFAPDGRTIVSGGWQDHTIRLWEVASGKERIQIRHPGGLKFTAFGPDGRSVASAGDDQIVRIWDISNGKERRRLEGHRGSVLSLAFSPDGKRLASGSNDNSVLLWDVAALLKESRPPTAELNTKELEGYWADLEGSEPAKAHGAIWSLAAAQKRTVDFLRSRVKPAALGVDHGRIDKLIADLDSQHYTKREQAMLELEKIGGPAEGALKRTLQGSPSLEVRRRAEQLLERLEGWVMSADMLRTVRALEVLEQIATPEAKALLEQLARGTPDALLTLDAKSSLERLAGKP